MQEPAFIPKPGQVDYTNIRYAPVINCVVRYNERILVVQRGAGMRLYPNYWNGISGFLDDNKEFDEKVKEELNEELGIASEDVVSITRGEIFHNDASQYKKTWIVHPVLVDVLSDVIKLDWEAQKYRWIYPEDAFELDLLPSFDKVLEKLFDIQAQNEDWENVKARLTKTS